MNNENGQHHDAKERIAAFIQEEGRGEHKTARPEDLQKLQNAAGRLEQLLTEIRDQGRDKHFTEEERKNLKAAVGKLDHLLGTDGHKRAHDLEIDSDEKE